MDNLHPLFSEILKSHIDAITAARQTAPAGPHEKRLAPQGWTHVEPVQAPDEIVLKISYDTAKAMQHEIVKARRETRERLQQYRALRLDTMRADLAIQYRIMIYDLMKEEQALNDAQCALYHALRG